MFFFFHFVALNFWCKGFATKEIMGCMCCITLAVELKNIRFQSSVGMQISLQHAVNRYKLHRTVCSFSPILSLSGPPPRDSMRETCMRIADQFAHALPPSCMCWSPSPHKIDFLTFTIQPSIGQSAITGYCSLIVSAVQRMLLKPAWLPLLIVLRRHL